MYKQAAVRAEERFLSVYALGKGPTSFAVVTHGSESPLLTSDIFPCVSVQVLVPGTTTTALLQQLVPNTDYNVGVVALYSDGEGPAISDAGKTCKNVGGSVKRIPFSVINK